MDRVYEIDLPHVVQAKEMLLRQCFKEHSRKPSPINHLNSQVRASENAMEFYPIDHRNHDIRILNENLTLMGVDLNNNEAFEGVWSYILCQLKQQQEPEREGWNIVFLSEAVLLYLNPGVATLIFQRLGMNHKKITSPRSVLTSTFIFVDRMKDAVPTRQQATHKIGRAACRESV